jgi:hypothetical protein
LLGELLALELRTLGVPEARFALVVSCEGSEVTLSVERAVTGAVPARASVDLSRTAPEAHERLVALAASELLAQAERERREERPEAAPPEPAPPAPPPAPPTPEPEPPSVANARGPTLVLGGSLSSSGAPRTLLGGVLLGTELPLPASLSLMLDTRYERGTTSTALADVDWTLLSASLGLALESAGEPFRIAAGPLLRGGVVALEANAPSPASGERVSGPWLALAGAARGSLRLGDHALLFAGLEAGCVLAPVRGTVNGGPTLVESSGCFFGGSAGAGYAF